MLFTARDILSVKVVEENGEYRITLAGEKAADVAKMFPVGHGCCCGCCCSPAAGAHERAEGESC